MYKTNSFYIATEEVEEELPGFTVLILTICVWYCKVL